MAECLDCEPGTYTSDSTTRFTCARCDAGFSQALAGQDGCESCLSGTYQPAAGSTACLVCSEGKFATGGAGECMSYITCLI